MSKLHVYGVGNALVDLEYEIPESLLAELKVDKGLMTLIEEDRHHELLGKLSAIENRPCGGGSAANTITAVAQLGSNAFYSCKVANDETGDYFLNDLTANGVRTNLTESIRDNGHTGKCIVLVTPDAQRSMNTFLGITREISVAELDEAALATADYVYIEGYLVPEINARAAAVRARECAQANGVKTSLTLSDANMVNFFKDGLMEIVGTGLDLIFSNEDEAKLMFGTDSIEECVAGMKTIAKQFAITQGAQGALVFDGQSLHDIPAQSVNAVDTNGAGDIYAGTFLHGLSSNMPFTDCAEMAGFVCLDG